MIPDITHLQFLILTALLSDKRTGREIRSELKKQGQKKSLAAFYQLMSRMEETGYVRGWYETKHVDGQTVKERHYEIRGGGIHAWEETCDFYARLANCRLGWGGLV